AVAQAGRGGGATALRGAGDGDAVGEADIKGRCRTGRDRGGGEGLRGGASGRLEGQRRGRRGGAQVLDHDVGEAHRTLGGVRPVDGRRAGGQAVVAEGQGTDGLVVRVRHHRDGLVRGHG